MDAATRAAGPDEAQTNRQQAAPSPGQQQQAAPPAEPQGGQRQPSAGGPEQEEPRDLFVPVLVITALVGYALTAAIAWWEYNMD